MTATPSGWTVLDDDPPLLLRTYSIGPGNETNTLAVGMADGSMTVVSPCTDPTDEILADLQSFGPVSAIVAPNLFHTSAIRAWREAFPDLPVLAASQAVGKLTKKRRVPVAPVAELAANLPPDVAFLEAPATKNAETWVVVKDTLYCGDAFLNLADVPWFPMGWLLRPMGFGPGFRVNVFRRGYVVQDREAHTAWLEGVLARGSTRLVPGHGDVVDAPDLSERLRGLWEG